MASPKSSYRAIDWPLAGLSASSPNWLEKKIKTATWTFFQPPLPFSGSLRIRGKTQRWLTYITDQPVKDFYVQEPCIVKGLVAKPLAATVMPRRQGCSGLRSSHLPWSSPDKKKPVRLIIRRREETKNIECIVEHPLYVMKWIFTFVCCQWLLFAMIIQMGRSIHNYFMVICIFELGILRYGDSWQIDCLPLENRPQTTFNKIRKFRKA